jgi:hypothetical protein
VDQRRSWCDSCWADLLNRRVPAGLVADVPAGTYVPFVPHPPPTLPHELSSLGRAEHKIVTGGEVKSVATVAAGPVTDSGPGSGSGSFSGYLASFAKDHEGDTITGPAAVADSVKAVNDGAIQWTLTDSHSDLASDVVAAVTSAVVDSRGVRIQATGCPPNALRHCGKWSRAARNSA